MKLEAIGVRPGQERRPSRPQIIEILKRHQIVDVQHPLFIRKHKVLLDDLPHMLQTVLLPADQDPDRHPGNDVIRVLQGQGQTDSLGDGFRNLQCPLPDDQIELLEPHPFWVEIDGPLEELVFETILETDRCVEDQCPQAISR